MAAQSAVKRQGSRVRRYKAFRGHGDDRLGRFLGYISAANPDDAWHGAALEWKLPVVVKRATGRYRGWSALHPHPEGAAE
jgi:hypothetical protein